MLKDNQKQSPASSKERKDSIEELSGLKKLKSFDIDSSAGFVCDINTGICGPITKKKEGKE